MTALFFRTHDLRTDKIEGAGCLYASNLIVTPKIPSRFLKKLIRFTASRLTAPLKFDEDARLRLAEFPWTGWDVRLDMDWEPNYLLDGEHIPMDRWLQFVVKKIIMPNGAHVSGKIEILGDGPDFLAYEFRKTGCVKRKVVDLSRSP